MESIKIKTMTAEEIKKINETNVHFDVALRSRMESLDSIIKTLTAEFNAYKDVAKQVFGENGGNKIFHTRTTETMLLNMKELENLIGKETVKQLKNKPSKRTYVEW